MRIDPKKFPHPCSLASFCACMQLASRAQPGVSEHAQKAQTCAVSPTCGKSPPIIDNTHCREHTASMTTVHVPRACTSATAPLCSSTLRQGAGCPSTRRASISPARALKHTRKHPHNACTQMPAHIPRIPRAPDATSERLAAFDGASAACACALDGAASVMSNASDRTPWKDIHARV